MTNQVKNASEKRLAKVKNALTEVKIHDFAMGELSTELKRLGAPYGISIPAILKKASIIVESNIKGCFNLTDRSIWDIKILTEELDKLSTTISTYKFNWRKNKKSDDSTEMVRTKPAKVIVKNLNTEDQAIELLKALGYKILKPVIDYKEI